MADHYGRYKVFLGTIALSVLGYAIMALSIYTQSLFGLFIGRIITGFCSGNIALAQAAVADLTDAKSIPQQSIWHFTRNRGTGIVAGPWIGGKLANPDWIFGSGAFIFAAVAALINFFMVLFFFAETWKPNKEHAGWVF